MLHKYAQWCYADHRSIQVSPPAMEGWQGMQLGGLHHTRHTLVRNLNSRGPPIKIVFILLSWQQGRRLSLLAPVCGLRVVMNISYQEEEAGVRGCVNYCCPQGRGICAHLQPATTELTYFSMIPSQTSKLTTNPRTSRHLHLPGMDPSSWFHQVPRGGAHLTRDWIRHKRMHE